jgi:hypothetical protein
MQHDSESSYKNAPLRGPESDATISALLHCFAVAVYL